jgi:glutaredoxin
MTPVSIPALPEALLFVTPGCPHCAAVLRGLDDLLQEELIGNLTVIDAVEHPEQAKKYGVRAAPWLRLGPFTLTGEHSPAELRRWAKLANSKVGTLNYVEYLLKQGGYRQAAAFLDENKSLLGPLLAIVADPEAELQVRLGVSALLEAKARTPALQELLPQLIELSRHADHRVRADACHLLGLTGSAAAHDSIAACLGDAHADVREIAAEAMEELSKK